MQIDSLDSSQIHKIAAVSDSGEGPRKIRVAPYCRVSTDDIDQAISIRLQQLEYRDKIKANPNWVSAGMYVDNGFSGTNTAHRPGFLKLIEDCRAGLIDMVITKSVSRFARNLMDCIKYVEELKSLDPPVNVYFEQEKLDTSVQTSGIILIVLAMVAEEESHMKSEAMLLSLEWRFSRGRFLTPALFGYDKVEVPDGFGGKKKMLIINPQARNTAKIGLANELFQRGSIHYVGSEIRAIILSKMNVAPTDDICVISGESIAIEAALIAVEGSVTAVEYNKADRATMEDNVGHFGLHNVNIIEHVDERSMSGCPVPSLVFLVASASTDQELAYLTKLNPNINVVIYTLDFNVAAGMPATLEKYGINDVETIQVAVSTLGSNHSFKQQPAPWIITGRAR